MARFSAAFTSAGAGSTTLPIGSLYATTLVRPRLVEVHVWNTTATAVELSLYRLTTTGTQGSTVTAAFENDNSQSAVSTAKNTHTVAPTLGGRLRQFNLGAAIGAGVILTFGGARTEGLIIPNTTSDGIGVIVTSGTGQVCDLVFVWDE
jgi:hypothetical protein